MNVTRVAATIGSILIVLTLTAAARLDVRDSGPRAVLEEMLTSARHPDPQPVDPQLFAPDIEAFWSDYSTHHGREAVIKATEASMSEVATEMSSFKATATDVTVHRKRNLAWLTCKIQTEGTMKEGDTPYSRTVRSTFIFEKRDDRWQIVHEHSSVLPKKDK